MIIKEASQHKRAPFCKISEKKYQPYNYSEWWQWKNIKMIILAPLTAQELYTFINLIGQCIKIQLGFRNIENSQ